MVCASRGSRPDMLSAEPEDLGCRSNEHGRDKRPRRASIAVRGIASTFPTSRNALPASEAAAFEPGDGGYS